MVCSMGLEKVLAKTLWVSNGGILFLNELNTVKHATPRYEFVAPSQDDLPELSNGALLLIKNAYSDDV